MGVDAATPPGFWERVRQIVRDEIAKLLRSGLLRSASIGEGGLTLRGGFFRALFPQDKGGGLAMYFGNIVSVVTGAYQGTGLLLQDIDGSDIAVFRTDAETSGVVQRLYDSQQNIFFSNDSSSGQGMARPYIGGQFHATRYSDYRHAVTVNEWTTVARAYIYKQQPRLTVGALVGADAAGVTGEVRVMVENVQHGPIGPIVFGNNTDYYTAAVPGGHMDILTVEIQARRTSATGTVRVEPVYWLGRQT